MNAVPPKEFSRLAEPTSDLRYFYDLKTATLLKVLFRHYLLILSVAVSVLVLVLGCAVLVSKTYTSEALIQLTFSGVGGRGVGARLANSSDASGITTDALAVVESEVQVLKSDGIARRVLHRLGGFITAPITISQRLAYLWNSLLPLWARLESKATNLDRKLLALNKGLSIKADGKTYLIHVGYSANDPTRAATVANVYAEEYLASRTEASAEAARSRAKWLETQVSQAFKERDEAQQKVLTYLKRLDVIEADGGAPQLRDQQMRDLVMQVSAAHLARLQIEAKLERLTATLNQDRLPSAGDLKDSADAQRLIDAEVSAKQELSRMAGNIGIEHPLYTRAQATVQRAQQQLADAISSATENARVELNSARFAEDSLGTQLAHLKNDVTGSQVVDRTLSAIEGDLTTAQANLNRLRDDYREAAAMIDLQPTTAALVSRAEPLSLPTSPDLDIVAVLGGMAGLCAGILIVICSELRDRGFQNAESLKKELGIPCVGMVLAPIHRMGRGDAYMRDQAFKSLAIRTGLSDPKSDCAVVVVTSSVPGEGKTRLMHGLASALAELGRRVLIVERTDRSLVERHRSSKIQLEYIHDAPRELIMASPSVSYHQTTGVLVTRDHCKRVAEAPDNRFDVIIIEVPALLADVEALLTVRAADLVLFGVRWRATSRACVAAAFGRVVLGYGQQAMAVLTDVDLKKHERLRNHDDLYFHSSFVKKFVKS